MPAGSCFFPSPIFRLPVTVDTIQDELVLKLHFGLAPVKHLRVPCPRSRLPKFKYGYYLREVGERRGAPKLTLPFPKAAQDTACDPVARKCALQRLHARKRKAAKCAWDMSLRATGIFAHALSQLCLPKAPAVPQGLHDQLGPILPGQFLSSISPCSC